MIIISIIQLNMNFIILTKVSLKSQFVNYEIDNKAKIIELYALYYYMIVFLANKKKYLKKNKTKFKVHRGYLDKELKYS